MVQANVIQPLRFADARNALRHVFVRDLELLASIGVHSHEKTEKQRVRINLDLAVREGETANTADELANVVCYEQVVSSIRRLIDSGHVNLVETLAERAAALCLEDRRVRVARVRVEKLDVFPDATSVGVEIERFAILPWESHSGTSPRGCNRPSDILEKVPPPCEVLHSAFGCQDGNSVSRLESEELSRLDR